VKLALLAFLLATLPASPNPISAGNVQTEYGGANPVSFSEYYRGGAYVVAGANTNIPASGAISLHNFHGTARPVTAYTLYVAASTGEVNTGVDWNNGTDTYAANFFAGLTNVRASDATYMSVTLCRAITPGGMGGTDFCFAIMTGGFGSGFASVPSTATITAISAEVTGYRTSGVGMGVNFNFYGANGCNMGATGLPIGTVNGVTTTALATLNCTPSDLTSAASYEVYAENGSGTAGKSLWVDYVRLKVDYNN
jgi:hypothetical protein